MATSELAPTSLAVLDRYMQVAGSILDAPVVCVSLLVADNRLMATSYGMPLPIALLHSWSLMRRVSSSGYPLLITDGREDPLTAKNPSVRDGEVVSFMGLRLVASHGRPVGTLWVMDRKPRQWSFLQINFLQYLSALLVREFVSRNDAGFSDGVVGRGENRVENHRQRLVRRNEPLADERISVLPSSPPPEKNSCEQIAA